MPELPDIELYRHALTPRIVGTRLGRASVAGPSLLRSVDPPLDAFEGRKVTGLERLGKRLAIGFEDDLFLVIHLMIAGRLRWQERSPEAEADGEMRPGPRPGRRGAATAKGVQARLSFERGDLLLVEAGTHRRATLHAVRGREALRRHDPGGIDCLNASAEAFATALRRERRTLKRALTDPSCFSGIGNAYSDEILHRARLSPVALTTSLDAAEIARLHAAAAEVLGAWSDRLRRETGDAFPGPGDVTAFRPGFAVHGRFSRPCPDCGTAIQRIVRGEHETNYCPRCQTGGRILADRALSRLLKDDWPRTVEAWEEAAPRRSQRPLPESENEAHHA